MKLLFAVALLGASLNAQSVEMETRRVPSSEVAKWTAFSATSPVDTRERFDVFLRSTDPSVRGFRVVIRYQIGASVVLSDPCTIPNNTEFGMACRFPLPDSSARVLGVVRSVLVERESAELRVE